MGENELFGDKEEGEEEPNVLQNGSLTPRQTFLFLIPYLRY